MKRSHFIRQSSMAMAGLMLHKYSSGARLNEFPVVRIPQGERKFKSAVIEKLIAGMRKNIPNKELGWLFGNCFPNTLDTTVEFEIINGKPDTFVITGDIDAMWLRDSSAQVWPYLPLMAEDKNLKELIKGVINRQVKCILKDPYANAFYKDENKKSEWASDKTEMKAGVHERKWEIDSLCYPIRLAHGYWEATKDTSPFDKDWLEAMRLIVKTFKEQQRLENSGPYKFERTTSWATDGVPLGGYGYPTKKNGLIHSMFRPSDDATVYPFLIPSNLFAVKAMEHLGDILEVMHADMELRRSAYELGKTVSAALEKYSVVKHEKFGNVIAYEVNGFGSYNIMDDANIPSILSMPYLIGDHISKKEEYLNSRRLLLSEENPFFFKGKAGEGIGGPHVGINYIWPMSIIMRALTSKDDKEIKKCLEMLQNSHASTGFMHEAFHKDDIAKFSRKWFAWANTLFGELIWKVYRERPQLLG